MLSVGFDPSEFQGHIVPAKGSIKKNTNVKDISLDEQLVSYFS